jgi:hypothetical protein
VTPRAAARHDPRAETFRKQTKPVFMWFLQLFDASRARKPFDLL